MFINVEIYNVHSEGLYLFRVILDEEHRYVIARNPYSQDLLAGIDAENIPLGWGRGKSINVDEHVAKE